MSVTEIKEPCNAFKIRLLYVSLKSIVLTDLGIGLLSKKQIQRSQKENNAHTAIYNPLNSIVFLKKIPFG